MITLYGFGRVHRKVIGETRDLRAQWALEESGLPYRLHGLDHTGGELDGEAYSKISYFHQAPVIDDEGFIVAESAAMLLYVAEKSGKLIPADFQGRTRVTQWCFAALATVEKPLEQIQWIDMGFAENKERRPGLVQHATRVLTGIERRLEGREWIACTEFTVADILLASVLRAARKSNLIESYPNISAYFARTHARPAWQRTLASYATRLGVTVDEIR